MWNALIDAQYNRLLLLQELFKMLGRKFDWDSDSNGLKKMNCRKEPVDQEFKTILCSYCV